MYLNPLFFTAAAVLAVSAKPHGLSRAQHRNINARDSILNKRSLSFILNETMEGPTFFEWVYPNCLLYPDLPVAVISAFLQALIQAVDL